MDLVSFNYLKKLGDVMKKNVKKNKKSSLKANNVGLGVYVGLSLVVYVCVYFFLSSALKVIIPSFMVESLSNKADLILTAVLMTTFMSFGVLMFLTQSTMHKVLKVAGICIMASSFVYLYALLIGVFSQV